MVNGYWLTVIGYWLLVIGYWLLVIGAAHDPDAPYNQALDEDEEIALLQAIYYPKRKLKNDEQNWSTGK